MYLWGLFSKQKVPIQANTGFRGLWDNICIYKLKTMVSFWCTPPLVCVFQYIVIARAQVAPQHSGIDGVVPLAIVAFMCPGLLFLIKAA